MKTTDNLNSRAPARALGPALWATVLLLAASLAACGDEQASAGRSGGTDGGAAVDGGGTGETDTGGSRPSTCRDIDKDGFLSGAECAEATDCDDKNAQINPDAAEVCGDRRDNDCSGAVDEGCPCQTGELRTCSTIFDDPNDVDPESVCAPGVQRCVAGAWSDECEGEGEPGVEICDRIDNDCDGEIDEEVRNAFGVCLSDLPPDYMPPPESCGPAGEGDGIDNNGDGSVDEGCACALPAGAPDSASGRTGQPCYAGPIATLGVGACRGGTRDCTAGSWGACADQVVPVQEICGNAIDDDCDGVVDDGCVRCVAGGEEICDGIDNDCDGVIDEGLRNACGGCGPVEATETCGDGIDNDCNGSVDEGCACTSPSQACYSGPPEAAGRGICARGSQACEVEQYGACAGSVLPQLEQCGTSQAGDGLDNDCDGEVDEGCGCVEGATRLCGEAAGVCSYGTQTCAGGVFGACEGGEAPGEPGSETSCDGLDNDCDGLTDEGLLNACGACDGACYTQGFDPTAVGNDDEALEPIAIGADGNPRNKPGLTLGSRTAAPSFLWAANTNTDGVSKIDTNLNKEVARYWVGDDPSRTAVDLDGNVWIFGRQDGRVTKIWWNEADCDAMRDGDPALRTSREIAGTVSVINSAADPLADECVAYSEVLNTTFPSGRGIAVTGDGMVWFGFSYHRNDRFDGTYVPGQNEFTEAGGVQGLDARTFTKTTNYQPKNIPYCARSASTGVHTCSATQTKDLGHIYGLIADKQGNVWAASAAARPGIAKFDPTARAWTEFYDMPNCGTYGIVVDAQDRIWTGCWSNGEKPIVAVLDTATKTSQEFYLPSASYNKNSPAAAAALSSIPALLTDAGAATVRTSALGVEPATGDIWITHNDNSGAVSRLSYDAATPANSTFRIVNALRDLSNTRIPEVNDDTINMRGVGFDSNGFAWHLGIESSYAFKINPTTNARELSVPMPGAGGHYTYSDFTGSSVFSITSPRGLWRYVFDTKFADAQTYTIDVEAHVPAGTTLGLRVRPLNSTGTPIGAGEWTPAVSGGPEYLDYPNGATRHVFEIAAAAGGAPLVGTQFEIEILVTTTDAALRPILYDLDLGWARP